MKKNTVLIISLSIILAVSVLLGFFFWPSKQDSTNILNFIPSDALFIVESKQIHNVVKNNSNDSTFAQFLFSDTVGGELKQFDSIFQYLPLYLNDKVVSTFSVHEIEGKFSTLFYLTFTKLNDLESSKKMLSQLVKGELQPSLKYEGEKIELISLHSNTLELYIWSSGKYLVCSTKPKILNRAIHLFHLKKALDTDINFTELRKTSGRNVDANIYINLNTKSTAYSAQSQNALMTLLGSIKNYANWCTLDFTAKDSSLVFNGFSSYNKDYSQYLSVLEFQKSSSLSIDSLLPDDTYKATILNLSSTDLFKASYDRYLKRNMLLARQQQAYMHLDSNFRCNISQSIYNQLDKTVAVFQKIAADSSGYDNFMMIGLKSPAELMAKFEIAHFPGVLIHPAANVTLKSYTIPASDLTGTLFGPLFSSPTLIYFTVWNNWLIGSESYRNTEKYIQQILRKQTLEQNQLWKAQKEDLSDEYVMKMLLRPEMKAKVANSQSSNIDNYSYSCLLFSPEDKLLYTSLFYQGRKEHAKVLEPVIFQAEVGLTLLTKGWFSGCYLDYSNKTYSLYLPNGEKKWSFTLPEEAVGKTLEVDAFHNGKYQLLFASKNKVYLVDRNGKSIEPFPLSVNALISGQISFIKYTDAAEGRIFVPTTKGVESYSVQGVKVEGWSSPNSLYPIQGEVQYCVVNKQDILYFNNGREWFFTNRQGKPKAQWPQELLLPKYPQLFVNKEKSEPCFIGTTKDGSLFTYELGKKYVLQNNSGISDNHFLVQWMQNNKVNYGIVADNKLIQYNSKLEKKAEIQLNGIISKNPEIKYLSNNEVFIIINLDNFKVCVYSTKTNSIKNINLDNPKAKFNFLGADASELVWVNNDSKIEKKSIK